MSIRFFQPRALCPISELDQVDTLELPIELASLVIGNMGNHNASQNGTFQWWGFSCCRMHDGSTATAPFVMHTTNEGRAFASFLSGRSLHVDLFREAMLALIPNRETMIKVSIAA